MDALLDALAGPLLLGLRAAAVSPPVAPEEELVRRSRGGDREAFGALVRAHEQQVFRLCGRFFRRREDVEEAAQETFLRAWRRLGSYRSEAPFEHWLTRVCLNRCYEILRRRRPDESELPEALAAPGDAGAAADAERDVRRALAALAPADRFVLLMLHGEGWTVAEIAERLGWSQVNVKVRAHRARLRLRRALAPREIGR